MICGVNAVAVCVSSGTEHGPPGPPGLPAAPAVASASRCGSGPAATPPPGTAAEYVWGRTARRGEETLEADAVS